MPSTAKGRILPRSLSRSRAYAGLSTHAKVLYPLLMTNGDDQGRLSGDSHQLKWEVCPNVEEITIEAIPQLLLEMASQGLTQTYEDRGQRVVQLLTWWEAQAAMQWAYPSDFCPAEGWNDRLRFRRGGKVITINWPGSSNGAKGIPLSELAYQLSFSASLNAALGKAIGKPQKEQEKEEEQEKETTTSAPRGLPDASPARQPSRQWTPYSDRYGVYHWWRKNSEGYVLLSREKPPRRGKNDIIQEHRWIWLNERGEIPEGYGPHHKDEDPGNNRIENLELMPLADHASMHAGNRARDPQSPVHLILKEMKSFLGYPGEMRVDPIPSYGKEGAAIKRMLARGFTPEAILAVWRGKIKHRGQFVSMVYVNEDIGKETHEKRRPPRRGPPPQRSGPPGQEGQRVRPAKRDHPATEVS